MSAKRPQSPCNRQQLPPPPLTPPPDHQQLPAEQHDARLCCCLQQAVPVGLSPLTAALPLTPLPSRAAAPIGLSPPRALPPPCLAYPHLPYTPFLSPGRWCQWSGGYPPPLQCASRRRQLQTRSSHHGVMPKPPLQCRPGRYKHFPKNTPENVQNICGKFPENPTKHFQNEQLESSIRASACMRGGRGGARAGVGAGAPDPPPHRTPLPFLSQDIFTSALALEAPPAPSFFFLVDVPGSAVSCAAIFAFKAVRDNRAALLGMLAAGLGCVAALGAANALFEAGAIAGRSWCVLTGLCIYTAYGVMAGPVYDRLVAATRFDGTCTFLIYLSDGTAYAGTIVLLMYQVCLFFFFF